MNLLYILIICYDLFRIRKIRPNINLEKSFVLNSNISEKLT
jgi:hypothetical protein